MSQIQPKLSFYVDCSHSHDVPYVKIPLPHKPQHAYIKNRSDFKIWHGEYFSVTHPNQKLTKNPTFYQVSSNNVFAKPSKTNRWPEALLAVLIMALFIAFLVSEKDFDIDKHFNLGLAAIGIAFIVGLFIADVKIRLQRQAADIFNNS